MELENVVPWGRSLSEYTEMFGLSDSMQSLSILGCGDGPASFNSEATKRGWNVVSADPIYRFTKPELISRIEAVRQNVMREVRKTPDNYIWETIQSPDELEAIRMNAMHAFLDDYETDTQHNRYVEASLPSLPFTDKQFDVALCSHFLFLYSTQFNEADHLASIKELIRVAKEIRIYPLVSVENNEPSPHLEKVIMEVKTMGLEAELVSVPYAFQKGATHMLRIM